MRHRTRFAAVGFLAALAILLAWLFLPTKNPESTESVPVEQATETTGQDAAAAPGETGKVKRGRDAASDPAMTAGGGARVYGLATFESDDAPAAGAAVFLGERRVVADEDGAFAFEGVEPGKRRLSAALGAMLSFPQRRYVKTVTVTDSDRLVGPITLRLSPGAKLRLQALAADDDRPLANATVTPIKAPHLEAKTDARGVATLTLTPETWDFQIAAPMHRAILKAYSLSLDRETRATVRLSPGGALSGRVADQEGIPLAGVHVSSRFLGGGPHQVRTDDLGRYALDSLPLDQDITLLFFKEGFKRERAAISLSASQPKDSLDVRLVPTAIETDGLPVAGIVIDEMGQPIAGAAISSGGFGPERVVQFTDQEGRFATVAPEANYRDPALLVEARGFAPQVVSLTGDVALKPLEIILAPGRRLAGRVVDEWGGPVAEAAIQVRLDVAIMPLFNGEPTRTDGDGRFELDSLPINPSLTVTAEGYSRARLSPEVDRVDLEITLLGQGVILGKAVAQDNGRPVREFNIRLSNQTRKGGASNFWSFGELFLREPGVDFSTADGAFRIDGLHAGGACRLIVNAPGYAEKTVADVAVLSEAEAQPMVIELEPTDLTVAGVARDQEGRPQAGARATLLVNAAVGQGRSYASWSMVDGPDYSGLLLAKRQVQTGRDGRFSFESLPEERPLHLFVEAEGMGRQSQHGLETRSREALTQVEVVLAPEARIMGEVDLETYADAGRVSLLGVGEAVGIREEQTLNRRGAAASFEWRELPVGQYQVKLEESGSAGNRGVLATRTVDSLSAGETAVVDFGPEDLYRVAGQVFINQMPMTVGEVFLIEPGQPAWLKPALEAKTDGDGRFVFKRVKAGVYDLVAFTGRASRSFGRMQMQTHPNRETIDVQQDIDRPFHFTKIGSMLGRLTPPPAERVFISGLNLTAGEGGYYATNDDTGAFRLDKTPPGEYRLVATYKSVQRVLLDNVVMPPDGSDLDLGDIPFELGDGHLRILIHGIETQDVGRAEAFLWDTGGDGLMARRRFDGSATALFEDLYPGRVRCQVRANGYRSLPNDRQVNIIPGEVVEVVFDLEPIAELSFSLLDGTDALAEVTMTRADNGAVIHFQATTQEAFGDLISQESSYGLGFFTEQFGAIRGAPPAIWTIRAAGRNGGVWTQEVVLETGSAMNLTIKLE